MTNLVKIDGLLNDADAIFSKGSKLMTDSRTVAKVFGKQHAHILRDIKNLQEGLTIEFSQSNFGSANYIDNQGKSRSYYEITKDGFMLLVMGFTGTKALQIKIAYIEAFNHMEETLYNLNNDLLAKFIAALEAEKQSFALASLAGRVLQRRKEQKRENSLVIELLQNQVQPLLPLFSS